MNRWLATVLAAMIGGVARGGTDELSEYSARRWTTDNGLPASRVTALARTPDGYLWCGTWFGLARFDGVRFTVFDSRNTPAFRSQVINDLQAEPDGTLWIATGDGLLRYRDRQFTRFGAESGLIEPKVWELGRRLHGGVWLRLEHEVGIFQNGVYRRAPNSSPLPPYGIYGLQTDSRGRAWFCSYTGLWRCDPDGKELAPMKLSGGPRRWDRLQISPEGDRFWVIGRDDATNGAALYENQRDGSLSRVTGIAGSKRSETAGLHLDRRGTLWVSSAGLGIFQLIDNRLSPLVIRGEAAPADFTCGLEDDEGNLWFGSEQGLWRARRPMLRTFSRAEGLVDNNCWSVSPGQDGTVWVNTTGGLGRIRDEKPLPAPGKNPNLWWDGRCVLAARDGNVWIGESGLGVFLLRGENYSIQLNWEVEKWSIQPWVLYEDPQNRIWGGFGHAVAVRIGETWRHWEQPAGWASDGVRAIHQARDGAMWFGTYGHGLVRHPRILAGAIPESLTNAAVFGLADGLKSLRVWAIYETDDGALWLGTENGLHRVPPGFGKQNEVGRSARSAKSIIHAFAAIDGLPEETVNAILEDDFGYFWLSGLRGIHRIKRAELEEVASGKRETVSCETFGADDGMASPETNGESQPAACKTPDGRLWFPTVAGVVVIDPRQLGPSEISPSVLLEEMAVDGATVLGDTVTNSISINGAARKSESHFKTGLGGIRLAPGQARVVQIRYTSPTFVGADKIRFRHRLRGLNDAWHEAGAERQAWFTNLKPGDYTFEVIASNSQGVWVTPPARIEFSLAPGFTQTAWFPALLAVAGASMAGGFIKWRLQWHRRASRAEQTAAIADERTRIARDLHDDLGTALTGLALELDLLGRDGDSEDADRLAEAARHARALGDQMREVVWVVNPLCDTLPQFAAFVEQQASQLVGAAGMRVRFDFPDPLLPREIGADTRHQFALATREALNNVARHSAASEVMVRLHADGCWLEVRIEDDGRGFQLPSEAPLNSLSGHGLSGLVERMTKVGGECRIVSSAGAGTQVILRAPLSSQASPSKKGEKT